MKRTIKEYVEPTAFEDKALFDDFKDSIGGRCFNKDSVYRWVYKLTDIKPTDDEIYDIMDKWVKNKWAYKKDNERTGANFYYFDLKETVSESKKIVKEHMSHVEYENPYEPKSDDIYEMPKLISFDYFATFNFGTYADALDIEKNNSEGWRMPNELEAELVVPVLASKNIYLRKVKIWLKSKNKINAISLRGEKEIENLYEDNLIVLVK